MSSKKTSCHPRKTQKHLRQTVSRNARLHKSQTNASCPVSLMNATLSKCIAILAFYEKHHVIPVKPVKQKHLYQTVNLCNASCSVCFLNATLSSASFEGLPCPGSFVFHFQDGFARLWLLSILGLFTWERILHVKQGVHINMPSCIFISYSISSICVFLSWELQ